LYNEYALIKIKGERNKKEVMKTGKKKSNDKKWPVRRHIKMFNITNLQEKAN
jgi:hypothetical protein